MSSVDVLVEEQGWRLAIGDVDSLVRRCWSAARGREPALSGAVTVLFADDETVRDLNRRFRGFDKPTNVLSFPSGEAAPDFLGDVALAFGVASREAADSGASLEAYAAHLIVHGLLHLVGYDHIADADAAVMERLESDILDGLGVYNPYAGKDTIET